MSFLDRIRRKPKATPTTVEDVPLSVIEPTDEPLPQNEGRDDDRPFGPDVEQLVSEHQKLTRAGRQKQIDDITDVEVTPLPERLTDGAEASPVDEADAPPQQLADAKDSPPKKRVGLKSLFARKSKGAADKGSALQRAKGARRHNYPVRVLIGYLPGVTEKDALAYALGIADKHIANIETAFYDVFPYHEGFVYEVHEGGTGAAFTPAVIDYYESLGPFQTDVDARMHIPTATRAVELTRKQKSIESVLLPESIEPQLTPVPDATTAMRPAMNKRTGVLVVGATVFVSGFFAAVLSGTVFRYVELDDIRQPAPQVLNINDLPVGQLAQRRLEVPEGKYVKALRYDAAGKWRVELGDAADNLKN